MLAGVLVDVSGSMRNSLQLHVQPSDQDITRAQSIFHTIMNIVDREVNLQDDHNVFVLAFGLQDVTTCDLLALLDYLQTLDLQTDGNGHENLIGLLRHHGAPYVREYVVQYVNEAQAQYLFKFYSQNIPELRQVVADLPLACKTKNVLIDGALLGKSFGSFFGLCDDATTTKRKATQEQVNRAMKRAKDMIRQRNIERLRTMKTPQVKTFQSTVNLLNRVTGTTSRSSTTRRSLTRSQLSALTNAIEPFIYGNTPMCEAIRSAVHVFRTNSYGKKVLFLLSDGESTDGNPVQFAQQLRDSDVTVFACLLTSNNISHPRRLYYEPDPNWTQAQKQLFELSSTVENSHSAMSILLEQNWELPSSGHSRLFIQANHPDVINEFTNVIQYMTENNNVLLDMISRVTLDVYINAARSSFEPQSQKGRTCYAYAVATVFHLAMRRTYGRENGVPDFDDICQKLIDEYGKSCAMTEDVLRIWAPKYRLQYKKVDELGARQAINQRRPVVATFRLDDQQWDAFSKFYKNNPKGSLETKHLCPSDPKAKISGHAVVLMKIDPASLTFINSWGPAFADGGFFRVRNQAVLNLQFYDVYWTVNDLKPSEIQAFQTKSSDVGQKLIRQLPPGIQNLQYECPQCHQRSPVNAYTIRSLEAECPKCHHCFKPTPSGLDVNAYTH